MFLLVIVGYVAHPVTQSTDYPHGIAVDDINADGIPDVIVSSTYSNQLFWFEHDEAWGFTPHLVASPSAPLYAKTGDIDGDGSKDIVVGDYMGSSLYIYYNTSGDGSSFTQSVLSAPGAIWEMDLGDIDNDGDLDIAATTEGGVVWFENTGLGFTRFDIAPLSYYAHACRLFDVDNDGDLDIAFSHPFNVYKNDGSGNFSLFFQDNSLSGAWGLDGYDIDLDGDVDVVVNDYDGGAIYIYWNDGATGFTKEIVALTGEPEGLDAGDVNDADGGDILVGAASGWVECFYYTGSGFVVDVVAGLDDADLAIIADLNNDMCNDLVVSGPLYNTVMAYENTDCAFGTREGQAGVNEDMRVVYGPAGPWLEGPGSPVEVYDPTGRLVARLPGSSARIGLGFLGPGTYVARSTGHRPVVFTVHK